MSAREIPAAIPAAAAAKAFITLCSPNVLNVTEIACPWYRSSNSVLYPLPFSSGEEMIFWAVTSAAFSIPNVILFAWIPRSFTMGANRSSSALITTVPLGFVAWNRAHFSCRMASLEPKNSIWLVPIFVMTAMSGCTMSHISGISPGWPVPISNTAAWKLLSSRHTVRGSPIVLLKFPMVFRVWYLREKTSNNISLVVVFPLLPVTATVYGAILAK